MLSLSKHGRRPSHWHHVIDRRALLAAATALALPGCARAIAEPPAGAGTTRLDLRGDRIFVAVRVNGVATTAIVDSAATLTVLDRAFAAPLGLAGGAAVTARGTGAATTAATLAAGARIDVAGLTLTPASVALIDLAGLAARIGVDRIDVILGRDLFDGGVLALDLGGGGMLTGGGGTLHVVAGDPAPPGVVLPLTPRRGVETVPVTIEGVAAAADFDLGNGGTVLIGAAFAARHRLLAGRATGVIPGGGIGGATQQTTFTLASLDLAGHRFADLPVAIDASPSAADANIGVRLLRRFGVVTDFPHARVWLDFRG